MPRSRAVPSHPMSDTATADPSVDDFDLGAMLDDLRLLVEVESPSRDVDSLRRSAETVADRREA